MSVPRERVHHASGRILVGLSLTALLTVIVGFWLPPLPDEGTGAHIFQLTVMALVPTFAIYLATSNASQSGSRMKPVALSAILVAAAFVALYVLEHVWYHRSPR